MKIHTSQFKEEIKKFGRQIDSIITYELDDETITLGKEDLNSITPTFQSSILKSAMKQLDIDSNVDIPLGTKINYQFGVLVNDEYKYLNYGNYIVFSSEKQEDTDSYKIVCYDKMLYSMVNYKGLKNGSFPMTVKEFLQNICKDLYIDFKDSNFANQDRVIEIDLYKDLGYTYRDVLDEISEVTASTICLNDNDELEVRYIEYAGYDNEVTGETINIEDNEGKEAKEYTVEGRSIQNNYSGKNKIEPLKGFSKTVAGVTVKVNDDYSITINGTATSDNATFGFFNTIPSVVNIGNTLSIHYISGSCTNSNTSKPTSPTLRLYNTNWDENLTINNLHQLNASNPVKKITRTTDSFIPAIGKCGIRTDSNVSFDNFTFKVMYTENDDVEYEPYVGGIPSPNPDYPQDVHVVSGNITIKIQNKNLIDLTDGIASGTNSGITATKQSDNTYTFIGTASGITPNIWLLGKYATWYNYTDFESFDKTNILCTLEAGTYTIKDIAIFYIREDGTKASVAPTIGNKSTFTISKVAHIVAVRAPVMVNGTVYNTILYPQLERGNDATSYEKGVENITEIDLQDNELCSLPNGTKDELVVENGIAKIIKKVGKVVLDGSENWRKLNLTFYVAIKWGKPNAICTHFTDNGVRWVSSNEALRGKFTTTNTDDQFKCMPLSDMTLDDFKTWLSQNHVTVYYVLEKPETIQLTPTQIPLFEGTNNLSLESNIPTQMTLKYTNEIDTINEEYLKDVNVNFGEKYGPVNSIVLSRAAESDNVYIQDEESIEENGLTELKIVDNQIMNFNDRSDYLPELLERLDGLEYYLNDFSSTGICYYDICDKYRIKVFDNIYECVMFNDEVNITQGLEENVYTDMPEETETDYTKADKTDQRINQTYLIVDKQNQQIEGVISQTTEQNDKIAKISATVDELNSKISDIADITISKETTFAKMEMERINQSEPILIKIRPIGENIDYLYPKNNLFPSDNLFSKNRILMFHNKTTGENIPYPIPIELLYYNSNVYDEFYLSYDNQLCYATKRCGYDENGNVIQLDKEETKEFEYPEILLTDGDYEISLLGYTSGYLNITLMAANVYTTQFATKVELNSEISQTNNKIELGLSEKLDGEEFTGANIILQINNDESVASINADKISLEGKTINLTSEDIDIQSNNFKVDKNGNLTASNANINGNITSDNANITGGSLSLRGNNEYETKIDIYYDNNQSLEMSPGHLFMKSINGEIQLICNSQTTDPAIFVGDDTAIFSGAIETVWFQADEVHYKRLVPISVVEEKKNFEKLENALNIIKDTDIYKFNYKDEENGKKKHIGFIIGKDYKYSKELTGEYKGEETGADLYSLASVCLQGIKEQQDIIENLQKQINELKEMIDNG